MYVYVCIWVYYVCNVHNTYVTAAYDYLPFLPAGVYLVKQVLRSKHRIRLLDYELKNLHKLKLRLAKEWKTITEKADDDVK